MNEERGGRNEAPENHERSNPAAGANAFEDDVAGHLKKEIAEEKYSSAKAIDRIAEVELGFHLQGGKTDIDTIEISNDVEKEKERKETQAEFGQERVHRLSSPKGEGRVCAFPERKSSECL